MSRSGFSHALGHNTLHHSSQGGQSGANDQTVATAADNGGSFDSFLGPLPPFSGKQRAAEKFSRETFDMPDRYADETEYLTGILDFFIIDKAEFWCNTILPWRKTDSLNFQWNVWKFDRTIADIEPHQGVPRLVTSSRSSRSSSLVRRGLAFMIEHGFYNTDQGRESFALNLKQITDAVHTTCYSDVLHSLLQANAYYKEWNAKFGVFGRRQSDVYGQERRRWSIVSKSARGLYLLDQDLKSEFRREGVTPTAWIWPESMSAYLHMIPETEVSHKERGNGAYAALASGAVPSSFRGLPVFESHALDVDFNGAPLSLLERDRMCGEWWYINKGEQIAIFSAEHDRFIKITYADAKKADILGASRRLAAAKKAAGDAAEAAEADNDRKAAARKTAEDRVVAPGAGVVAPDDPIIIWRPFQTWTMASCILCRAGSELGNTFHGHHDMQLQNDAVRKIMVGHYTFYSRAVVKNDKMVSVVEDVMARAYVAGEGVSFFNKTSFTAAWQNSQIGTKECDHSLIAMSTSSSVDDIQALPDAIDMLGDFPDDAAETLSANTQSPADVGKLEAELGLGMMRIGRNQEKDVFLKSMQSLNTVCFKAHTKRRKSDAEPWVVTERGTGHWGANVYPGVASHRTGRAGDGFIREQPSQTGDLA